MAEMKNQEKNGANRCPHCGATDVKLNLKTGKLKCSFCRSEFDDQGANARGGVENLQGDVVGEGAGDIIPDEKVIVTLKCPACGAEVVINTDEATSARCHWCRHTLSINEKMPNGAVPDLVLPFKTEKSVAENNIREFVKKRQFFAHPKFKKEFAPNNVMGVYMPYMIVDVNAHADMRGEAEHLIRRYTSGSGNNKTTYYDAEAFAVTREFDLLVDDLTIESSSKRLQQDVRANTNNVINAIMPFDTENAVAWNPNYLHGFASERRDTNINDLREQLNLQVGDIARYKVKESMTYYNRGAKWVSESVTAKGTKWKAAYLPVWLYSYLEVNGDYKMLHYVAVNARTGETMGSVPINKTRLLIVSSILEILGIICGFWWIKFWLGADIDDDNPFWVGLAGLTPGFIFYWLKSAKYRNMNARHKHEAETPATIKDLKQTDVSLGRRNRLRNSSIEGRNDSIVKGVVAKAGERMMGEKMANFIGIGRMAGSTPSQTPIGQQTEAQIRANKKTASLVAKLIVFAIVIPMILAFVAFVVIAASDHKSSKSSRSSSSVSSSAFASMKEKAKTVSSENRYLFYNSVNEIVMYNLNSDNNYDIYELNSSNYKSAFSVKYTENLSEDIGIGEFVTDTAKNLDEIVSDVMNVRLSDNYYNRDDKKMMMRLYTGRNRSDDTLVFCDLRETLDHEYSSYNRFETRLNCVEIDEDTAEENDIRI
ncbi:MAG: hypothetical protein MJ154_01635 [Candidatus Saccharibacteria bacterium]|nr:hypothetical protein [Candidatus Saccharibacteria bacterium]